ncbi:MAG: DeoR family transcriptional regulator [Candidatus Nealsonbacteria bacterium]|nr:DeoR family transcriptional regulator [Candidatus Nealsonbacteria bacterium]
MNKDFLIQLTNNLYRLTILFPKKEPLRYKMRELADDILVRPSERDLEALNRFFEVAKTQNWVSPFDVLAIQKDYDNIREELNLISEKTPQIFSEPAPLRELTQIVDHNNIIPEIISRMPDFQPSERNERQERILAFLRENGRAQVWEVKQVFPEVTKRTLRRDFEQMLSQGVIERMGEKNNTFYQTKVLKA